MSDLIKQRSIPELGFGTWQLSGSTCRKSVEIALETGYRHIDTAQLYENEEYVGQVLRNTSVPREELFVATKLDFNNLAPSDIRRSTEESLEKLGLDTIDLLYVHWPAGPYDAQSTLPVLDELKEQGRIHAIGLSNFTVELLKEAQSVLEHPIYALQVEMHAHLQQNRLHEFALEHDMYLVAYSPLKRGRLLTDPIIQECAEASDTTPAQVCLSWLLSKERVLPIPKATGRDHIEENFEALDLDLSKEQLKQIDQIGRQDRVIDPPFAPW